MYFSTHLGGKGITTKGHIQYFHQNNFCLLKYSGGLIFPLKACCASSKSGLEMHDKICLLNLVCNKIADDSLWAVSLAFAHTASWSEFVCCVLLFSLVLLWTFMHKKWRSCEMSATSSHKVIIEIPIHKLSCPPEKYSRAVSYQALLLIIPKETTHPYFGMTPTVASGYAGIWFNRERRIGWLWQQQKFLDSF